MKNRVRCISLLLCGILVTMPGMSIHVWAKPSTAMSSSAGSSDLEEFQDDSNDLTKSEVLKILKEKPTETDANTIVALYKSNKNEAKLNRKYNNKHVLITGKVKKVSDDSDEVGMTVYIDDDDESSWVGIGCSFDSKKYEDVIAELDDGDYVEIDGVGEAGSWFYTVEHCQGIKKVSADNNILENTDTGETAAEQAEEETGTIKVDKVVYDQNGIKVRLMTIEPETFLGSLLDYQINFEIENNSQHEILVTTEGFTVNGYMTDDSLYELISAGAKDKCDVSIYESDIKETGKEEMSDFSFKMEILDTDTYDTLGDFSYKYDAAAQ